MKQKLPIFFSIIIPTCNRPHLLLRALEKIQLQSYVHFEVLIINNGTKPELVEDYEVLEQKFDSRYIFFNFHNNDAQGFGPSIARNIGLNHAKGNYIAFCDDDDEWIDNDYLLRLEEIITQKQPQLILADQFAIKDHGELLSSQKTHWLPNIENYFTRIPNTLYGQLAANDYFYKNGGFPHLNISAYEINFIKGLGGFNRSLWYEEDLELFLKTLQKQPLVYYYHNVIANHYVPDKKLKKNVTSDIDEHNKFLMRYHMTTQLIDKYGAKNASPLLLSLASSSTKHLCTFAIKNKERKLAKMYAQQAMTLKPSLKWAIYTFYLVLLNLLGNKA